MQLSKHHGLGNDFLVLTDRAGTRPIDAALARAACDRNRGIGADGLLHLGPAGGDADASMVLLNADGSRAEMSGNGIGCLTQAAVWAGMVAGPSVAILTDTGVRTVHIQPGERPRTHIVSVGMGPADLAEDDDIEWTGGDVLRATRVSMGNPHLVLQVGDTEQLDDRDWVAAMGRRANEAIAGGINVEVIAVDDDGGLRMDVYERGVGLTLACGTGACAAAAAARRWELVGDRVMVRMVGGPTIIDLAGSEVVMTTPIVFVANVELPWP